MRFDAGGPSSTQRPHPQPVHPSSCSLVAARRLRARPFMAGKSTMRSPSPSHSTVCSKAALGWHLSRCHLTPVPDLVMPNASGCAAAGSFSPACADSMPVSSLGQSQCGAPRLCASTDSTPEDRLPLALAVGVQSRAPLRFMGSTPDRPASRSRRRAPSPFVRATVHAFATIPLAFASGFHGHASPSLIRLNT